FSPWKNASPKSKPAASSPLKHRSHLSAPSQYVSWVHRTGTLFIPYQEGALSRLPCCRACSSLSVNVRVTSAVGGTWMTTNNNRVLYQLKVTLLEIHPPIWRRIQIGEDATLAKAHRRNLLRSTARLTGWR
ncbi:MAG: hypothetical protein ABSF46_32280, partial [Terriglobia bacterium]